MKEPSKKTFADVGNYLWRCDPEMFNEIISNLNDDKEATS